MYFLSKHVLKILLSQYLLLYDTIMTIILHQYINMLVMKATIARDGNRKSSLIRKWLFIQANLLKDVYLTTHSHR